MFKVSLTEEHMKSLYICLDKVLKVEGLNALSMVTDLHNALSAAVVATPTPAKQVEMSGEPKSEEEP
jgi:hypothetical protein